MTASLSALPEDTTSWDYGTTLLTEKGKRMAQRKANKRNDMNDIYEVVAVSTTKYNRN